MSTQIKYSCINLSCMLIGCSLLGGILLVDIYIYTYKTYLSMFHELVSFMDKMGAFETEIWGTNIFFGSSLI